MILILITLTLPLPLPLPCQIWLPAAPEAIRSRLQ
jgi:hypothetical protein